MICRDIWQCFCVDAWKITARALCEVDFGEVKDPSCKALLLASGLVFLFLSSLRPPRCS